MCNRIVQTMSGIATFSSRPQPIRGGKAVMCVLRPLSKKEEAAWRAAPDTPRRDALNGETGRTEHLVSCPSDFNRHMLPGERAALAGLWSSTQRRRVCSCGQHGDVESTWPSMQLSGSPFLGKGTAWPCVLLGGTYPLSREARLRFPRDGLTLVFFMLGSCTTACLLRLCFMAKVLPQPACSHTKGAAARGRRGCGSGG